MSDEIREWASTTNYTGGNDVGTPTKVDPGDALAAEGWRPGPLAAQHLNYLLNQLTALERDRYEGRLFEINEDFSGAIWDSSGSTLYADHVWRGSDGANVTVNHGNGTPANPGELRVSLAGDSTNPFAFRLHLGGSSDYPTSFSTFERFMVAVKNDQHDTNTADLVAFGLTDDVTAGDFGNNHIRIFRAHGNQWRIDVESGGSQTVSEELKTYVDAVYETFELVRLANGDVEVLNNGNLVYTIDSTDCPGGSCNLLLRTEITVADSEVHTTRFDLVKFRGRPSVRQD